MADYPVTYAYSSDHEWISVDGEIGTVGVTAHAQDELGDVVYVELPEAGASFERGAAFGTIESVKAVSDLYTPVGGEIVEVNDALVDEPETVNADPHGAAWMVKIKIADAAQLSELMSAEDYQRHIED